MVEAEHNSKTSVYFIETTRCCVAEGYHIHTRRRESLKSHNKYVVKSYYLYTLASVFPISTALCNCLLALLLRQS